MSNAMEHKRQLDEVSEAGFFNYPIQEIVWSFLICDSSFEKHESFPRVHVTRVDLIQHLPTFFS